MPTSSVVEGNTVINFTAAELNAVLIDAAATFIGEAIDSAQIYVLDADGGALRSPEIIRSARVVAIGVVA
jgi:hypothetical protein